MDPSPPTLFQCGGVSFRLACHALPTPIRFTVVSHRLRLGKDTLPGLQHIGRAVVVRDETSVFAVGDYITFLLNGEQPQPPQQLHGDASSIEDLVAGELSVSDDIVQFYILSSDLKSLKTVYGNTRLCSKVVMNELATCANHSATGLFEADPRWINSRSDHRVRTNENEAEAVIVNGNVMHLRECDPSVPWIFGDDVTPSLDALHRAFDAVTEGSFMRAAQWENFNTLLSTAVGEDTIIVDSVVLTCLYAINFVGVSIAQLKGPIPTRYVATMNESDAADDIALLFLVADSMISSADAMDIPQVVMDDGSSTSSEIEEDDDEDSGAGVALSDTDDEDDNTDALFNGQAIPHEFQIRFRLCLALCYCIVHAQLAAGSTLHAQLASLLQPPPGRATGQQILDGVIAATGVFADCRQSAIATRTHADRIIRASRAAMDRVKADGLLGELRKAVRQAIGDVHAHPHPKLRPPGVSDGAYLSEILSPCKSDQAADETRAMMFSIMTNANRLTYNVRVNIAEQVQEAIAEEPEVLFSADWQHVDDPTIDWDLVRVVSVCRVAFTVVTNPADLCHINTGTVSTTNWSILYRSPKATMGICEIANDCTQALTSLQRAAVYDAFFPE